MQKLKISPLWLLSASIFIVFLRPIWTSKQHHKENQQVSMSSWNSHLLCRAPLIIPDGVPTVLSSISSTLLSKGEDNLLACQHCSHNQWRPPKICHNHLLLFCQWPTSNSNLFTTKLGYRVALTIAENIHLNLCLRFWHLPVDEVRQAFGWLRQGLSQWSIKDQGKSHPFSLLSVNLCPTVKFLMQFSNSNYLWSTLCK